MTTFGKAPRMSVIRVCSLICLLATAACQLSCSIPNLEDQQCSEARDTVREFYSWYLGTDPGQRDKQPEIFAKFIAPDSPMKADGSEIDPFFNSASPPTTFKIGKCEVIDPTHANIQVQLYWRQDAKVEQKEVYADTVKTGDKWLINKIENR